MKAHGYASGTRKATKGIHLVGEAGNEIGIESDGLLREYKGGEVVFNNDMAKKLYDFAGNPAQFVNGLINIPSYKTSGLNSSIDVGGININKIVTDNPEDFARQLQETLAKDTKVRKIAQDVVLGTAFNGNSLSARRFL